LSGPPDPKKDSARRCLKLDAWPEADRRAWQAALRKGDVLEPGGLAARWGRKTQAKVVSCYGRWLTWLSLNGLLDSGSAPAERATPANVARYVGDLQALGNAPYTVLGRVRDLHNALRAMVPGDDWAWVLRIARRLRWTVESVRDKRARIAPTDELFAYGIELMIEADGPSGGTVFARAMRYRDGLMIAMLAARPVRRANFASIEIGRHLVRQADGYQLRFEARETKTHAPYVRWLPEVLIPYLERYLDHYRPILAARTPPPDRKRSFHPPGTALWLSIFCSAMSEQAIYYRIRDLTKAKFGHSMSPHLFRDAAATSIATKDPEHVYITTSVLAHRSLATSERHYNHARSLEASRRFQGRILELRRQDREHQNCGRRRDLET
jgi:integrase/recombinase XerD